MSRTAASMLASHCCVAALLFIGCATPIHVVAPAACFDRCAQPASLTQCSPSRGNPSCSYFAAQLACMRGCPEAREAAGTCVLWRLSPSERCMSWSRHHPASPVW